MPKKFCGFYCLHCLLFTADVFSNPMCLKSFVDFIVYIVYCLQSTFDEKFSTIKSFVDFIVYCLRPLT